MRPAIRDISDEVLGVFFSDGIVGRSDFCSLLNSKECSTKLRGMGNRRRLTYVLAEVVFVCVPYFSIGCIYEILADAFKILFKGIQDLLANTESSIKSRHIWWKISPFPKLENYG